MYEADQHGLQSGPPSIVMQIIAPNYIQKCAKTAAPWEGAGTENNEKSSRCSETKLLFLRCFDLSTLKR